MKKIIFCLMFLCSLVSAEPCYHNGMAIEPLTACANQGDVDAQRNMGQMYYKGEGSSHDYQKAFEWYSKAAEQGDAVSQSILGVMYTTATGVTIDDAKAFEWYSKAAEQGDATAQQNLGKVYARGDGTAQDFVLAYMWLNLAISQNNPDAIKLRDQLAKKMTSEQIINAQQMTSDWLTRHPKK